MTSAERAMLVTMTWKGRNFDVLRILIAKQIDEAVQEEILRRIKRKENEYGFQEKNT